MKTIKQLKGGNNQIKREKCCKILTCAHQEKQSADLSSSYLEAISANIQCCQKLGYVRLWTLATTWQQQRIFQYEILQEHTTSKSRQNICI